MVAVISFGCLAIWLLFAAFFTRFVMAALIKEEEAKRDTLLKTEKDYLEFVADNQVTAIGFAIIWPVTIFILLSERQARSSLKGRERLARLKAEEELRKVKRLARENGLVWPDD